MESTDKGFLLQYFRNYLKQQKEVYMPSKYHIIFQAFLDCY